MMPRPIRCSSSGLMVLDVLSPISGSAIVLAAKHDSGVHSASIATRGITDGRSIGLDSIDDSLPIDWSGMEPHLRTQHMTDSITHRFISGHTQGTNLPVFTIRYITLLIEHIIFRKSRVNIMDKR